MFSFRNILYKGSLTLIVTMKLTVLQLNQFEFVKKIRTKIKPKDNKKKL